MTPCTSAIPVYVPSVLCGIDGEPLVFVSAAVADTPEAAVAYAVQSGDLPEGDPGEMYPVAQILMRELDPIACKIRGYEEGWWVECTPRAKKAHPFWRIEG